MIDLLRGQVTSAWVVGLCRGIVEGMVFTGLLLAANAFTSLDFGANTPFIIGLGSAGFRTLEGLADHIDPSKTSAPKP